MLEQLGMFTGRNLKIYFRDKGAIFFSLLSMLIVIGLMMFFLGDMNVESVTELLAQFPNRDNGADEKNAELLILSWTCAGILSINAVTVTLAAYSVMIKDRVSGKINSFYTSPVNRLTIAGGYVVAAWIASVCVCVLTLALTEVYGMIRGLAAFSFGTHLELLGMIMVNSFTYAALMYGMALIAKTEGAWSGIGTVIGTLVGFLGGIYIPIGALSEAVSAIMKVTPIIYGTAMFRDIMTKDILNTTFQGIPNEIVSEYCEVMGIRLTVLEREIGVAEEWLILLTCGIIFLILGVCALKYSKKTDR